MRDRVVDTTVRILFNTNDGDGAPVAPSSAFAASDFRIYKNGSATEKTTTDGVTVTSPFDSIVGLHLIEIDTSNDTNYSGGWELLAEYRVVLHSAKTVDGVSQSGVIVDEFRLVSGAVELDPAVETQIDNIENAAGYMLAVLAGTCTDPQTASETYAITVFGSTFTVDMAGQTSTGTRTAPTLTKT
jgi:hypothetical protein